MNEKSYEALEVCLKALETGATPGSVLKLFPGMEEELLPLLQASQHARMVAITEVPDHVLRRNRVRVLQHAASMREADARQRRRRVIFVFPRLAISLAIAFLFLLSGTGLVRASDEALPGDNLYPVKRTWEDLRLLLIFNPESRNELKIEFERERLHEIDELLAGGRHETITFAGVVTEQNGNLWIVSGVPVQIMPDSRLPAAPVPLGASIILQGRTNAQGFVEVDFLELIANIALPTSMPTEIRMDADTSGRGPSGSGENDNDHRDRSGSGSSSEEDHDRSGSENKNDEKNGNSNSGTNENDGKDDHSNENNNEDDKSDNKGSGGGGSDNENESHD